MRGKIAGVRLSYTHSLPTLCTRSTTRSRASAKSSSSSSKLPCRRCWPRLQRRCLFFFTSPWLFSLALTTAAALALLFIAHQGLQLAEQNSKEIISFHRESQLLFPQEKRHRFVEERQEIMARRGNNDDDEGDDDGGDGKEFSSIAEKGKKVEEREEEEDIPPLVLGWNPFFGSRKMIAWMRGGENSSVECPYHCEYSDDRHSYSPNRPTMFVFHAGDLQDPQRPQPIGYHLNAFFSLESPMSTLPTYKKIRPDYFNLTISYRVDSEVWWPYASPLEPVEEDTLPEERWSWEEVEARVSSKTKPVLLFVSHCQTGSRREDYVRELMKYINVTQFGRCNNRKCHHDDVWQGKECLTQQMNEHFFYLAFENSVCNDYVTEKFWNPVRSLAVPVVLSRKVFAQLPTDRLPAYIAADDFDTPQQLAEHLLHLQHNRGDFLKLLEWTSRFKRPPDCDTECLYPGNLCQMCEMLHKRWQGNVPDMVEYWDGGGACLEDFAVRTLLQRGE